MYQDNFTNRTNHEVQETKVAGIETTASESAALKEDGNKIRIGLVTGCKKLNIREEPNASAAIVCEVACQTELMINENESTDEFYKVCTAASVEGFCMKRFIAIQ